MRLIDADAIYYDQLLNTGNKHNPLEWAASRTSIDATPTIDPVKHGRWIKMSDANGVYWSCGECGEGIPRISHFDPQFDLFPRLESIDKTSYCPHCGARMDGGEYETH